MRAGFTEHEEQQLGRAIGHFALLSEGVGALHEESHAQHALDLVEAAQAALQQCDGAQSADFRAPLRLFQRDIGTGPPCDDHRVAHPRNLPTDVNQVLMTDQRHVIAANLDLAVEVITQLLTRLFEAHITRHSQSPVFKKVMGIPRPNHKPTGPGVRPAMGYQEFPRSQLITDMSGIDREK